jgi:hypothetical protein
LEQSITLRRIDIRRAVLAWLFQQNVAGAAVNTPTRIKRYRADIAGFWNQPKTNANWQGPDHLLVPSQTIIVECRVNRDDCWPDCIESAELLPKLRDLKHKRMQREEGIREQEPQLRETAVLFEEYTAWDYEKSCDKEYHRLCRQIETTEKAIYKGSRFESMRSAGVADLLYLAVPEKAVHPHELADGWGLIWVNPELKYRIVAVAENRHCKPENRFHLIQNIASSTMNSVLFSHGIKSKDGKTHFLPLPRSRRIKANQD